MLRDLLDREYWGQADTETSKQSRAEQSKAKQSKLGRFIAIPIWSESLSLSLSLSLVLPPHVGPLSSRVSTDAAPELQMHPFSLALSWHPSKLLEIPRMYKHG